MCVYLSLKELDGLLQWKKVLKRLINVSGFKFENKAFKFLNTLCANVNSCTVIVTAMCIQLLVCDARHSLTLN